MVANLVVHYHTVKYSLLVGYTPMAVTAIIDISAKLLPLYMRKIWLIFGEAEFRCKTKFKAEIRLQSNVYS